MLNKNNCSSRRSFVKGIGMATLTPLLQPFAFAAANKKHRQQATHRLLSCNIRVALPEDDAAGVGWKARKETCIKLMQRYKPDLICLQEVLKVQMDDLREGFPAWDAFGFDGPEMDAHAAGYHGIAKNPIMFSRERYEIRSGSTYWLSETPLLAGSQSWGTARARHCNWVRLKDKQSGREFRVVNTHLDHISQEAREKQTGVILTECAQYAKDFPQLFAGDFNSRADNPVMTLIKAGRWKDSYAAIHGEQDPGYTAHDFKGEAYGEELKAKNARNGRIDFIFSTGGITPKDSSIIKDKIDGRYPSDHYFMCADVGM